MAIPNRKSIKNPESGIQNERGRVQPASRQAWRTWLKKHHATSPGVWLVFAKKHTAIPSLTYDDAVEEALCFGWIDSLRKPLDDRLYQQLFTPRKVRSRWSGLNKTRVARLIEQGLMTRAGMAVVDLARRSGTWDALSHVDTLSEPEELRSALDKNTKARANWEALTPGRRKQFLYWLSNARRQDTRTARVKEIVAAVSRRVAPAELAAARKT